MVRNEIERSNLLNVIGDCLDEHVVDLANNGQVAPMALIEVGIPGSIYADFMRTYGNDERSESTIGELDGFGARLAKAVWGDKQSDETYGVFVNPELQYDFTFNRRFADLNAGRDGLVFKSPEEVLVEAIKGSDMDVSLVEQPGEIDTSHWDDYLGGDDGSSMEMRYALQGPKPGFRGSQRKNLSFQRNSLLGNILEHYTKNKSVCVRGDSGPEDMMLDHVSYKTRTFDDFMGTYRATTGLQ
jgi:hypothetical protein